MDLSKENNDLRVAIISDLHFGITSNNKIVEKKTCQWLKKSFFPFIKKNNINNIIFAGDLFHNRKAINTESGLNVVKYFIDLLPSNIYTYIIPGNHDAFYNDNVSVNSPYLLMHDKKNIIVVDEIMTIGNLHMTLFPWGTKPGGDYINGCYAVGHFDIIGALMNNNITCQKGLKTSDFSGYEHVFSGHYHMPSVIENIEYVGNPIEQNWSEINFDHQFIVLNVGSGKREYIKTSEAYKIFYKVLFESNTPDIEFNAKDTVVKIVAGESVDYGSLIQYRDKLIDEGAIDVKIIESSKKCDVLEDDIDYELLSIVDMINCYIDDNIDVDDKDKKVLKKLTDKLYNGVDS